MELPRIKRNNREHYVDFRMGEIRDKQTAKATKFRELSENKYSDFKKELRGLRARHWRNEYIQGIDD